MLRKHKTLLVLLALVLVSGFTFGGNLQVKAADINSVVRVHAEGKGIWIIPGKRPLDPQVFGTPTTPLRTDCLPLDQRAMNEEGNQFTTTKNDCPYSNKVKEITGNITIEIEDKTVFNRPNSSDKVNVTAEFNSPDGNNHYRVELNKLIMTGPNQYFGGVGTNLYMFGATGLGTPLMPNTWSYVTLWGYGDLYRNGEKVGDKRFIRVMVTPRLRDENYKLGFGTYDKDKYAVHLILQPRKVEDGKDVESPVPTDYQLPDGNEQDFIHVDFHQNMQIKGNQYIK